MESFSQNKEDKTMKKKMGKRIACAILCILIVAGFVGCGAKKSASSAVLICSSDSVRGTIMPSPPISTAFAIR